MQIEYLGQSYSFEAEKITVDEWRELKRKYKLSPKAFSEGLDEADPDAMTFAWWVILGQNGQRGQLTLGDHLKPDIIALNNAFGAATQAEAEPEPEADPTKGLPSTPTSPGSPSPAAPVPAAGGSLTA